MSVYYIEFDTNTFGMMKATRVELKSEVITDKDKVMSINLRDDPLYPKLVEYVKNNPL
jgi:chromatin segregation and condensation protein Rec8/ScpA/Scc1 (kleisin family)